MSRFRHPHILSLTGLLIWGLASLWFLPDAYQVFSFIFLIPWVWQDGLKGLRWAAPIVVGYILLELLLPKPNLNPESLLVTLLPGLAALSIVAYQRERDRRTRAELEQSLHFMQVLEQGSINISVSGDPLELTDTAMDALFNLGIAPHIAFVRFREGKPVVVSAKGALDRYRGRHLPQQKLSTHASLSDSFTIGSYLEGIPESAGWSTAAVPVSARQNRPLGVMILAREGNRPFQPDEKALATSLSRVLGAQLGQMGPSSSRKTPMTAPCGP